MRLQRQVEIIIQSPSGTMERWWHGDLMMKDTQMFLLTPYLSCRSLPELIIILPSPMMVALWLGDWMIQGKRMFPTRCHPCLVWLLASPTAWLCWHRETWLLGVIIPMAKRPSQMFWFLISLFMVGGVNQYRLIIHFRVPVQAIAAGRNHNLALLTNGTVVAWATTVLVRRHRLQI